MRGEKIQYLIHILFKFRKSLYVKHRKRLEGVTVVRALIRRKSQQSRWPDIQHGLVTPQQAQLQASRRRNCLKERSRLKWSTA